MSRDDLERQILDLWVRSRIPLTRAHIQYATGVRRQDLDRWLDELTLEGAIELDLGGGNELEYRVPGAERPLSGATTFEELDKKRKSPRPTGPAADADQLMGKALTIANAAGRALREPGEPGKKKLAVSGALSLLGPVGWLYAGDYREAIPATIVFLLAAKILPAIFLWPLLMIGLPLSAITGLVYAWQYNREGQRMPIFLPDPGQSKKDGKPKKR